MLFLFSTVKYSDEALSVIEASMRARFPHQITFYHAYLDDPHVEEKPYRESLAETLRRRYAGVKMDVVIACNPPPLNFAREYRGKVFHDAPIVFFGVGEIEMAGQKNWPGVTGVVTPSGFRQTIDLALRLQPDTQVVAIIAGATRWDSFQLGGMHAELVRYRDKVEEIHIVGAPKYPRLSTNGCIGGAHVDNRQEWTSTADLATQVLSGVRPEDISIVHVGAGRGPGAVASELARKSVWLTDDRRLSGFEYDFLLPLLLPCG